MDIFRYTSEYEHVFVLFLMCILFFVGLRKRECVSSNRAFSLDKQFSGALKGMACVMILMSHFEAMMHLDNDLEYRGIAFFVGRSAANIALVWFMFISGYGLTVSKRGMKNHITALYIRCAKVLYPMLFIFFLSLLVYLFLPGTLDISAIKKLVIPQEIYMFKGALPIDWGVLFFAPIRWYWFVWCILMYYIIFYLSDYFSQYFKIPSTYFLIGLLIFYYIAAFNILGPSLAHYYRLTWAFLFGHLFASWEVLPSITKWGGYLWASSLSVSKGQFNLHVL